MTPQEKTRMATLEAQVQELLEWKQKKEKQQLSFPLDEVSVKALNNTLRRVKLDRINVRDIYFTATTTSPTVAGQMRFYNDGATQNMRINTTYTVFTGTVDLTAV